MLIAPRAYAQNLNQRDGIRRVLLISVDGMHALDYENCVIGAFCPTLATLGKTGVNYTRTSTSRPSDSIPGLMALVTGGTPKTVGAFYDVAYDRLLAPPKNTTGNGLAGGNCVEGKPNATTTEYEEGVEIDQSQLNGGFSGYSLIDGGIKSIDPAKLPRDPFNHCSPVYPWQFIRTNSIYAVIHAAGGYTAWSDKHAVYAVVSGHGDTAGNVDDYYSPEVNSNLVNLPGVTTANGVSCATPPENNGQDWTRGFDNIKCYDQLKVNAILNEIDGKDHLGMKKTKVPVIFGMNFQAVSVGQKLVINSRKGGYTDAAGTPTPDMKSEIVFVDAAIGQMVKELKHEGLYESTAIIITAKHGQSPIDTNRVNKIPDNTPATLLALAGMIPDSESPLTGGIGPTEDDVSQIWLKPGVKVTDAVAILENNGAIDGLGQILYGPSLETMFNAGGLPPNGDSRTPDIIVLPNPGVIYSGSSHKQSEHGGFAHDDTNVMMLVSNPAIEARTVNSFVETAQVAPTILSLLGLDPNKLDAVRAEGTPVLPGLNFRND